MLEFYLGRDSTVLLLINKGALLDERSTNGQTPLNVASLNGKRCILQFAIIARIHQLEQSSPVDISCWRVRRAFFFLNISTVKVIVCSSRFLCVKIKVIAFTRQSLNLVDTNGLSHSGARGNIKPFYHSGYTRLKIRPLFMPRSEY